MRTVGILLFSITIVSMMSIAFADPTIVGMKDINPAFMDYLNDTETRSTGIIPEIIDFSYMGSSNEGIMTIKAMDVYPPYFDLREQGKVTSVKDQGSCGSCWAFASYSSLESYLMPSHNLDFSEHNMINLHGFDWSPCSGGNRMFSIAYLARWSGPISEADDPYDPLINSSSNSSPIKHVQEVIFIPSRESSRDNNAIKTALQQYGAVAVDMYYDDDYYNADNGTSSYYYSGNINVSNHGVTIVGWDDSFDRDQFSDLSSVPPDNGAFIVKNSFGDSWGDGGYFYVSYYDSQFAKEDMNAVFTAEDVTNYNHIYQYDTLGMTGLIGLLNSSNVNVAWGSNTYTAQNDEVLEAVSFYTPSIQTSFEVSIYTNYTNQFYFSASGYPTDKLYYGPGGNLKSNMSGEYVDAGYHTVKLEQPVNLTAGESFLVLIKLTTSDLSYPLAIECPISGYSSEARANDGESYVSYDGEIWRDVNESYPDSNLCIKAFTSDGVPIDRAPELAAIGNKSINENELLSFIISAVDLDGDIVSYSANDLPAGASLESDTGEFTWTPGYDDSGSYDIEFIALANGLDDSDTIIITVDNVDRAPELDVIGNKTVNETELLSFIISATDPDGDPVIYSANNLPEGGSLNTTSGDFSWNSGNGTAGSYDIMFIATANGLNDSETITITVIMTVDDWNPWNDLDSEGAETITLVELQDAIYCWRFGEQTSTGEIVSLVRLQDLIYSWRFG